MRLALLPAATKLFFKRPPECQLLLGTTLAAAAADSNQDVHDRALLYYRLAAEFHYRTSATRRLCAYWACPPFYVATCVERWSGSRSIP